MLTYTAFLHLYPHPRRSMQTSAPVNADIRAGRCRHPRRSMQTSASVGADIRVGRCRIKKSNYYIISFTKQQ